MIGCSLFYGGVDLLVWLSFLLDWDTSLNA